MKTRTTTREMPFSMAFRSEAMIYVEVKVLSFRYENFDEQMSSSVFATEKDIIEKHREIVRIQIKTKK